MFAFAIAKKIKKAKAKRSMVKAEHAMIEVETRSFEEEGRTVSRTKFNHAGC